MKHIISLGGGVQSSTMSLMAAKGEITPMPDAAIFADTQAEPASVYKWLDWLETQLPFPVYRVQRNKNNIEEALVVRRSRKTGKTYVQARIPAFTVSESGKGQLWRQCTSFWKIEPLQQSFIKQWRPEGVTMWLGISTDEAHRMKDSQKPWIEHRWPLIEAGMSRNDCLEWMEKYGYPQPPRSACVFCPYHSDKEWIRLKRDEPEEFAKAVEFEKRLRESMAQVDRIDSQVFLHSSRKPLDTVKFKNEDQPNLFGNECSGLCNN